MFKPGVVYGCTVCVALVVFGYRFRSVLELVVGSWASITQLHGASTFWVKGLGVERFVFKGSGVERFVFKGSHVSGNPKP